MHVGQKTEAGQSITCLAACDLDSAGRWSWQQCFCRGTSLAWPFTALSPKTVRVWQGAPFLQLLSFTDDSLHFNLMGIFSVELKQST